MMRCAPYAAENGRPRRYRPRRGEGSMTRGMAAPSPVICWLAPAHSPGEALHELIERVPSAARVAVGLRGPDDELSAAAQALARTGGAVHVLELTSDATLAHLANDAAQRWPGVDLVLV